MAERANVDDTILRYADSMSPEEISRLLGGVISPATVAARTQTLLTAKDWLSEAQEDQLVTLRMKQLVNDLLDSKYAQDYKYMDIRLKALTALGDRLDKRRQATTVDLNTLYGNQGAIMARAYDIALSYMRGVFKELIDADLWDETAREALVVAQSEILKHEAAIEA